MDAWKKHIGGYMPGGALKILLEQAEGMGPGMLGHALELASEAGARNPLRYADTVLYDWRMRHIRTLDDAYEYEAIYDREQGKDGVEAMLSAGEEMDEFLARMEAKG